MGRRTNKSLKLSQGWSCRVVAAAAAVATCLRNDLYADFFRIFEADFTDISKAQLFLRRHLFRNALLRGASTHKVLPEREEELSLVDWKLTVFFLREVIGMDGKRVEKVRHNGTDESKF
jgi:hypothetical protein